MVGIRRAVAILCAALAACSGGEPPEEAPATAVEVPSTTASETSSLSGGAVLTLDDLDAAAAGQEPVRTREGSVPEPPPLPPALAEVLRRGPEGLALDPLDELAIAFEEQPGDEIPLLLGGTSVVDEGSLTEAMAPVPAAPDDALQ